RVDDMSNQHRHVIQRRCEDDWNNTSLVNLKVQVGRRTSILTTSNHMLAILHWDAVLALLVERNTNNKYDDAHNDHRKDNATVILQNLHTIGWKASSNTGEDQKRHTVADTLFGDQLAHPHHQHSTRSHHDDHDNERKQVAVWIQHFYPLAEKLLTIR